MSEGAPLGEWGDDRERAVATARKPREVQPNIAQRTEHISWRKDDSEERASKGT